mgnify:CR=1 FL=1
MGSTIKTPRDQPGPITGWVTTGYFSSTKTATYGFLAALPLLAMYEALILLVNGDQLAQVRVGADIWIKQTLALIGVYGVYAIGLVVLVVGIFVFVRERSKKIPLKPEYFGWMLGESAIYAVVVAFLVSGIVGLMFSGIAPSSAIAAQAVKDNTGMMLVLSIGAGLYEELIFRVVLVGGLFFAFKSVFSSRVAAYIVAALIGALVFSAVHYFGSLGDPFELPSFLFRFLFGLALNGIFLVRGFGIAAWTHALYDVLVVTQMLG